MFDDPQVLLGMAIGVLIVVVGTSLGVLGHRRKERVASHDAGDGR